MWHVSSRSVVATLRTAVHLLLTLLTHLLLTYRRIGRYRRACVCVLGYVRRGVERGALQRGAETR